MEVPGYWGLWVFWGGRAHFGNAPAHRRRIFSARSGSRADSRMDILLIHGQAHAETDLDVQHEIWKTGGLAECAEFP